jgi:hypothetical protein
VRVTAGGDTHEVVIDVRPTVVKSLVIAPAMVIGGAKATATITLSEPAPVGGALVMLSSTSATFPVTATVTIPAGTTWWWIDINDGVDRSGSIGIAYGYANEREVGWECCAYVEVGNSQFSAG